MRKHPPARSPVQAWISEAEDATWKTPEDVKNRYARLSIVGAHYIFKLGGNKYRLDCTINFDSELVLIVRIGTHAEYDTWGFE